MSRLLLNKLALTGALLVGYSPLFIGCASPQLYWFQPGKNLRETSADLLECRRSTQPPGGSQVYSAAQLERPCMAAKGYEISKTSPPKE
jgi:hypothetical protein